MKTIRLLPLTLLALAACQSREHARADSVKAAAAVEQSRLAEQLSAQKDSLTRVVLEADDLIMRIDSTVSTVKGLPKAKREDGRLDPLAQQIENRKAVMARVDALVKRARATSAQLAKAQTDNKELRARIESDEKMISDLNATIQRQASNIEELAVRVDSLNGVTRQLGEDLATARALANKAFYVIGKEDDLVKQGIVVREGGANLLIVRPGRTLQTARKLDPKVFTAIDQREVQQIPMPDTTRRYAIVSRQSLDNAEVAHRENTTFRGNLKITQPDQFWAASRFLVIVEK
jgi:hypothetical protein